MTAAVTAAVSASGEEISGQNHQSFSVEIVVETFDEFDGVLLRGFCFERFFIGHKLVRIKDRNQMLNLQNFLRVLRIN